MDGLASLVFAGGTEGGSAATRLVDLEQRAPLRVLFPNEPGCGILQAVLLTTGGGMVGGDSYDITVTNITAAQVLITTQAAEKVYRSTGADIHLTVSLRGDAGSWLEWMPQETILFEGARLIRQTAVHLAPSARFFGGEILVFGRAAHGERLQHGWLGERWQVFVGERLVWADALRLEGDIATLLAMPAGFDGAAAAATFVYAGPDAGSGLRLAQNLIEETLSNAGESPSRLAVTFINGLLVIRGVGIDARKLREVMTWFWSRFRAAMAGLPPQVPRVWLA